MLTKTVSGMMLTLLLMGMLTLAFNIQPVNAVENIYIRPDGSVDPPTAPITRDGDVYTFTDNIHDPVVVERNNIVVDGAGYTVQERPGVYRSPIGGINLFGRSNVTIKNVEIKGFETGIYLEGSSNNSLYGNNITNNRAFGIRLGGTNNILRNNTMTNNDYNFDAGFGPVNDVDVSNTVDGKPIYYWINKQEMAVPLDAGCVVLVKCVRITVQNLNLTNNAAGVLLASTENSTITKNKIANNSRGIYFEYSSNNSISGNNITSNSYGIYLWNSEYNSLNRNNITKNGCGIDLSGSCQWGSSNNNIYENNITNNSGYGVGYGIVLWANTNNNAINGNSITNNSYGIRVGGSSNIISENIINGNEYNLGVSGPSNSIDASNLVDGKPVYYLVSQKDLVINPVTYPQIGYLALVDCANVTVEGLTLTNNGQGIRISNTNNSKITGNNITNNSLGISLICSSNSLISRNNITNNEAEGGIHLSGCSSISIHQNNIAKNEFGIFLGDSSNNSVYENNITSNKEYGIRLCESSSNNINGNNIENNNDGIDLCESSNNKFFHNNFINNTSQMESYSSVNVWDDGYPSGGNYWSDYEDRYPDAKEINESGIWDTSYVIDEYNQDRYPLINPWTPPEHEIVVSITAPASIMLGGSSSLNATVSNEGSHDEVDVELLILVNSTIVNSTTVPLLQAGQSYTHTYVWTPTVEGIHNITAYMHPVLGEIYTGNNQETTFVTVSGFHELKVALKVPTRLALGDSSLINATVSNLGTYKEQNVTFRIFVDNTIVNSTTIPFLEAGSSHTISYLWTFTVEGAYNVTVYVSPVLGETSVENNQDTRFITVVQVGVKAGEWIKVEYTISGWPAGQPYPEWLKVEFLTVEGTNITVRVTMHMSNGTEQNATVPVIIGAGGGEAFGLSGFVIPANLTIGDSVYITGYGNVTIAGETTGTYAGASRTVVYASFSQYGTQLTYYWDKQTGVMVEASTTSGTMTGTAKATETNMWQPELFGLDPILLYSLIIVTIVVVAAVAFLAIRRKKKPPEEVESPQS